MKNIDMSVLPDGFLCERTCCGYLWELAFSINCDIKYDFRPALNHWHFNDGSMVLPDGLVVECKYAFSDYERPDHICINELLDIETIKFSVIRGKPDLSWLELRYEEFDQCNNKVIAVKILGVTPEYAEAGEALGMTVVEGV